MISAGSSADPTPRPNTSWASHLRETLALGLPLVGAQLAHISINVASTVMVGWLGPVELAAAVLATQLFYLFWIFGSGFSYAVMPLAAGAVGRADVKALRRSVRMGLWAVALFALLAMVPLWHAEAIFLAVGQDPAVSALAGRYMRVLQWSMLPYLSTFVLRSYFSAINRPNVILLVTILGALANVVFTEALIFGHFGAPALGMIGAAAAALSTSCITVLLLTACVARMPSLKGHAIFVRFWRFDPPAFWEVVRLGWPIGLTILAEAGMFTAAAVMVGWIGTIDLAAHGIALQLASVSFMVPLGLAGAATVRVGVAYGQRNARGIGRAARTVLGIAVVFAGAAAFTFWIIPEPLIRLYLDPENADAGRVLAATIPLVAIAAAFQLADTVQVIASSILRGLKDTRTPMLIAIASYWLVGMPTAYLLAFHARLGAPGIWWGLATGLLVSATLMTARFLRRERHGLILVGA